MKYLIKSALLFIVITMCSFGCDDVKDLVTVDVPVELSESIIIDLEEGETGFQITELIDAAANSDVSENLDNIRDYKITAVHYEVSELVTDGSASITSGEISFSETSTVSTESVATLSNVDLNAINGAGRQTLNFSDAALNKLRDSLLNGNQVYVTADVSIDGVPATFKLKIIVEVVLEVGAA